jgi:hypothetical protein
MVLCEVTPFSYGAGQGKGEPSAATGRVGLSVRSDQRQPVRLAQLLTFLLFITGSNNESKC